MDRRTARRLAAAATLTTPALLLATALPAAAQDSHNHAAGSSTYEIDLAALNNSNVSGTVTMTVDGRELTVDVAARGLVPGAPHAQHVHGMAPSDTDFMCPTMDDDADGSGILTTAEGLPSYGGIFYSLTTEGDTSADSGLAVDRFPVAAADGSLTYSRTFEISADAVAQIQNLHYVVHGIDVNGNGTYDNAAGPSELDPALPQEATAPAACGMIMGAAAGAPAVGGVATGSGPMGADSGTSALALGGLGAAAVAGTALTLAGARRRRPES